MVVALCEEDAVEAMEVDVVEAIEEAVVVATEEAVVVAKSAHRVAGSLINWPKSSTHSSADRMTENSSGPVQEVSLTHNVTFNVLADAQKICDPSKHVLNGKLENC